MKKNSWYIALRRSHVQFLAEAIHCNNVGSITEWITDNIVNSNANISAESKGAFYDAVKLLMKEFITEDKYDEAKILLDSVDSEKFKHDDKYQKLTLCQCTVIADVIKESKESLEKNSRMHEYLRTLLNDKYGKLTDKSKVSTLIEEALERVPLVSTSQAR